MTAWSDFLSSRGASFDGDAVAGFGDIVGELKAARDGAVLCDLAPLSSLSVEGSDAATFLQGQLTTDVEALAVGGYQISAWCSPKGRVLANFVFRRADNERFELLLPASLAEPIAKRLSMFVLRSRVKITDVSDATVRVGVGGPQAPALLAAVFGDTPALHRAKAIDGGTLIAFPGGRFIALLSPEHAAGVWERFTAAGIREAGYPCWQWLTVRAGVPEITPPTQGQFIPQMLNLEALEAVNFRKGCYTGQEIVARTQYLGRVKERLVLAHVDAAAPAAGERVYAFAFGDRSRGMVVTAAPAPEGGADLLAVVQTAAIDAGTFRLGVEDGPAVTLLPLPYPLPEVGEPRGRIA